VEISTRHKNQAVILYYKGDILTLWLFLTDLLDRYDERTICSFQALSATSHLPYILLLRVECNMLIHDLSSTLDKRLHEGWRFARDFFTLTQIIRMQSIEPELKTKAMALRAMMTVDPGSGTVSEIWGEITEGEHSQTALQDIVVHETEMAVRIHKEYSTCNGHHLRFARAYVKDALRISTLEAAKFALRARLLDRAELYFSHQMLVSVVEAAIAMNSSQYLRVAIRYAQETHVLGECGGMFNGGWWLNQRMDLADKELWKRAMEGGVWSELAYPIPTVDGQVLIHLKS